MLKLFAQWQFRHFRLLKHQVGRARNNLQKLDELGPLVSLLLQAVTLSNHCHHTLAKGFSNYLWIDR